MNPAQTISLYQPMSPIKHLLPKSKIVLKNLYSETLGALTKQQNGDFHRKC